MEIKPIKCTGWRLVDISGAEGPLMSATPARLDRIHRIYVYNGDVIVDVLAIEIKVLFPESKRYELQKG
jgi:hypothetical protein